MKTLSGFLFLAILVFCVGFIVGANATQEYYQIKLTKCLEE